MVKESHPLENFNPRPSHEGRHLLFSSILSSGIFQSTSLTRGTTVPEPAPCGSAGFQSTSLTRGTTIQRREKADRKEFQSTSLTRGTTITPYTFFTVLGISIHVPHTRDDSMLDTAIREQRISIHVPHTRDDVLNRQQIWKQIYFNPRPSHEGRLVSNSKL